MSQRIFLRQTPSDSNGWYTITFLEQDTEVTYLLNVLPPALREEEPLEGDYIPDSNPEC